MPSIKCLSDDIISQIAAGEVIDRLISIVKELVENSIDSGANKIKIQLGTIKNDFILVQDDGSGIKKDELCNTVKKHYTSKIHSVEDLYNTHTLGFRGEALYSISSVSNMFIASYTGEEDSGYCISLGYGQVSKEISPIAIPKGTLIVVEDIFSNLPVRQKFLKGLSSEVSSIMNLMSKFILLYPNIKFTVIHNDKILFVSSGTGDSLSDLISLYGLKNAKQMKKIIYNSGDISISGYISNANYNKKTKRFQVIGVNGRLVSNKLLYKSLENGTRGYLPPGLHSVASLSVKIDFNKVNPNIHPRKEEVQFIDEQLIMQHIETAVSQTLAEDKWEQTPNIILSDKKNKNNTFIDKINNQEEIDYKEITPDETKNYQIIGQIQNTYIVINIPYKTIFMDQHAAHERIIYQRFKDNLLNENIISRELEVGSIFSLSTVEELDFYQKVSIFEKLGFVIEEFGNKTYKITHAPDFINSEQANQIIMSSIQLKDVSPELFIEETLISISCKTAIKANEKLSIEKMEELVQQVFEIGLTNCPHGRPIYSTIPIEEIEKLFKRIV